MTWQDTLSPAERQALRKAEAPVWVFERQLDSERCRDPDPVAQRRSLDDTYPALACVLERQPRIQFALDGATVALDGAVPSLRRLQRRTVSVIPTGGPVPLEAA